jgi:hypothetical protein
VGRQPATPPCDATQRLHALQAGRGSRHRLCLGSWMDCHPAIRQIGVPSTFSSSPATPNTIEAALALQFKAEKEHKRKHVLRPAWAISRSVWVRQWCAATGQPDGPRINTCTNVSALAWTKYQCIIHTVPYISSVTSCAHCGTLGQNWAENSRRSHWCEQHQHPQVRSAVLQGTCLNNPQNLPKRRSSKPTATSFTAMKTEDGGLRMIPWNDALERLVHPPRMPSCLGQQPSFVCRTCCRARLPHLTCEPWTGMLTARDGVKTHVESDVPCRTLPWTLTSRHPIS